MKRVASIVLNNFLHDARVLKTCQSLQRAGYDVQVVALHEDGLAEHEEMAGVAVHRIALRSRNWSKWRPVQILKWIELLFIIIKKYRSVDIIHANDVLPLPLAVIIKKLFNRKVKIVYDAHELEFDKNVGSGFGNLVRRLEKLCIRQADRMITVTDLIADAYVEEYSIEKPKVVMNCPVEQHPVSTDIFRKRFPIRDDQIIVLYQGGLKPNRGIEQLVEAFLSYPERYVLVLMGYGVYTEQLQKEHAQSSKIFIHEGVPVTDLLRYTCCADIGIYLVQNTNRSHDLTIGNKLFEYIMSGLPVISSNLEGPKTIVTDELGVVLNDDSPAEIFGAIKTIETRGLDSYRAHARQAVAKYRWEEQEKVLLQVYQSLDYA